MDNDRIALNIKKLRKNKKYSQAKLAREMGMSRSKISSWELGRRNLTIKDAIRIAQIFQVSLDELLLQEVGEK